MTRRVDIPPFVDAAGAGVAGEVSFVLVDRDGKPTDGFTGDTAVVKRHTVTVPADSSGESIELEPNGEISPATYWRVTVVGGTRCFSGVNCTLLAGTDPIGLPELMQVGAPADPLDFWGALLLTQSEREALNAALNAPSAANPIATIADVTGGALPSAEADEPILAGQPIRLTAAGHAVLADAAQNGQAEVAGIAAADTASGFAVPYSRARIALGNWSPIAGSAQLTPAAIYYLDPSSPGRITAIAPESTGHYLTRLGRAAAPDAFQIEIEPPIRL